MASITSRHAPKKPVTAAEAKVKLLEAQVQRLRIDKENLQSELSVVRKNRDKWMRLAKQYHSPKGGYFNDLD